MLNHGNGMNFNYSLGFESLFSRRPFVFEHFVPAIFHAKPNSLRLARIIFIKRCN